MRGVIVFALFAGCGLLDDAPRSFGEKVTRAREHMHQRFSSTNAIGHAIAFGDLDRAKSEARTVADLDEPDVLPQWKPYFENLKTAAAQVADADDLASAANALAEVGRRCARCHEATDAKLTFARSALPIDTRALPRQMAGHEWAVERMWEGLIANDDARWDDGTSALAAGRLAITAESGALGIADDAARVRAFAARARKAVNVDDRARLYGELLGTCASCHAKIRDR